MATNDYIITRALNNDAFIWYLERFVSATVDWKSVSDKCFGKDNKYCLSIIKSKCWTDKTEDGGSWSERLESLILERVMLSINLASLYLKHEAQKWPAIILKIDPSKVSPFVVKMLEMIDNHVVKLLDLHGIEHRYMSADDLSELAENNIFINYNRVTWHCGPIAFKHECDHVVVSDTPFTPLCDYITNHDCINAGFMIWQFLLEDEFDIPNCNILPAVPDHLDKKHIYIDRARKG